MNNNNKLKIAFCQWTYEKDFEETKKCIERVSPYVDVTIINYSYNGNSLTEKDNENIKWLNNNEREYHIITLVNKFNDNFPEQRNAYLNEVKRLNFDWVCCSDPDELYSEELAINLRSLIRKLDYDGYSILSVPCRDQFDAVEWLDRLDMLKECPMGYRETDFWKPLLIYKVFDDIHYEGVGIEKNVHETLSTRYKLSSTNLPKQYYYIHKKSSLKIWRNAARNFFISGGGDNVGSKNRLWTELRQICSKAKISSWDEFEKLIESGVNDYNNNTDQEKQKKFIEEFNIWLQYALMSPPTKEGTETRETAKWYFALHKNEITPRIKDLIDKVADISEEVEVENYVTQSYYHILGRHPDETGKNHYVKAILDKKIKRSDLIDILLNSEEHKKKSTTTEDITKYDVISEEFTKYDKSAYDRAEKFVDNAYARILGRHADETGKKYYIKSILDKRLKPSQLVDILRNSKECREMKGKGNIPSVGMLTRHDSSDSININANKATLKYERVDSIHDASNTVALCIMGYSKGIPLIKQSIQIMGNIVNEIHVQGDDFTTEDINQLQSVNNKTQVHKVPWIDDFSAYKNKAISYANSEFVLILDHDEVPTEELANELTNIIKSSDRGNNYDMVSFDVIDVRTVNGKVISENRNKGGKPLLHWNIPSPYCGNPHIWLRDNYYPWKPTHTDVAYKHIKDVDSELQRSVRNIYMGGGGDNSKEKNPLWAELRATCNQLKIENHTDFDNYLKKGDINRKLLDVIIRLSELPWKDGELKDILRYYLLLHPEEEEYIENKSYRQKKFGDAISWEEHVNEILNDKIVYYPYDPNWDRIKTVQKYKTPPAKVLDAGCSVGRYINFFTGAGYEYTGIDQSQYAIDIAKKHNPTSNFMQSFLWDIKFENEFDIIFMKAVMQHNKLEEKKKIIPQLYKALKHGGIFLMDESTVTEDTETQLTHSNWINLVESSGFKFLESFHKNELDVDDCYVFRKL